MLTREMEIDDYEFKVTTMGSKEATALWFRASNNLGAVLAKVMSEHKNDDAEMTIQMYFGVAVQTVLNLPESDFDYILKSLASTTFVKGPNDKGHLPLNKLLPTPSDPFAGRMDLLVKYLMFALEVNFGSFLDSKYEPMTVFMTRMMKKDK